MVVVEVLVMTVFEVVVGGGGGGGDHLTLLRVQWQRASLSSKLFDLGESPGHIITSQMRERERVGRVNLVVKMVKYFLTR